QVNKQLQTDDPVIYAIGDVAGEPMLAHKASHEGRTAVEAIAGHKVAFEPNAIPAVVFTDPEISWCGLTETDAQKQNREIKVAKFPWAASGRAMTLDRTEGMTKLILDPQSERVLGVGIVGAGAGELIAEGVLAIEMGALAKDVALTIHPHPTLSETLMEAAEVFYGTTTDIYRAIKRHSTRCSAASSACSNSSAATCMRSIASSASRWISISARCFHSTKRSAGTIPRHTSSTTSFRTSLHLSCC